MLDLIDQSTGQSLMRWTIRLAVACMVLRFAARWSRTNRRIPSPSECLLWASGFLFYVCHVLSAFHFVHDWSHARAWQHTAEETSRLTGFHRGEGIWINYGFTIVWALDAVRLLAAQRMQRPTSRLLDVSSFLIFGFIAVNATVVFGPAHYRWLAIPLFFVLCFCWRRGQR